jgi:hypothetical protein
MPAESATLRIRCGKIASGKSTLAAKPSANSVTALIAEDARLDALFRDELQSLPTSELPVACPLSEIVVRTSAPRSSGVHWRKSLPLLSVCRR